MRRRVFEGKVALVTGASSGIGRALAVALGGHGARVGLLARRRRELEKVAATVEEQGGEALVLPTDGGDQKKGDEGVETAVSTWGRIDLAVANAGIGRLHRIVNLTAEKLRRTVELNLFGAWHLFEAVLPTMLRQESGHLVGISSISAFRAPPKCGPYSASKAALTLLMEAARVELKGKGIACTVIHPGFVRTPLAEQNTFPMPFIIGTDEAAEQILKAVYKKKAEAFVPRKLHLLAGIFRLLPNPLFDLLTGGL